MLGFFLSLIYFNEPVESYLSDSVGSVSLYAFFPPSLIPALFHPQKNLQGN